MDGITGERCQASYATRRYHVPHVKENIHKMIVQPAMLYGNHVQDTARGPGPAREPILSGPRDVPKL